MPTKAPYQPKNFPHPFSETAERQRAAAMASRLAAALLLLLALLSTGCHVTPYRRTLPEWVGSVYVPMAVNETTEPGLEELLTNAFTTELLADGRLDVVRKRSSNAVVKITIMDIEEHSSDQDVDNVESVRDINLTLDMQIFDASDMENPLLVSEDSIEVPFRYASSVRSVGSLLRVDAMDRLAEATARRLLHNLMSGMVEFEEPL